MWLDSFLTTPTQKIFNQLLIVMNLYQHAKNHVTSSICSRNMADFKNPAIWLANSILPVSQESDFSQIWHLSNNIASNIKFHYKPNSVKNNDQIFNKLNIFLAYFPHFLGKIFFSENSALSYKFPTACKKSEKTNEPILKFLVANGQTDRRTDGHSQIHRTLPLVQLMSN